MRKVVAAILLVIDIAAILGTFALMLSLIRLSLAAAHRFGPLSAAFASAMWMAAFAFVVAVVALLLEFIALAHLVEELARP
jgi:hypothetical protein